MKLPSLPEGSLGELHSRLRELHRDAGKPGAPRMAATTEFSHTTMRRLMVTPRTPKWTVLRAAVERMCPLAQWPLEPTITEFHRLLDAVADGDGELIRPVADEQAVPEPPLGVPPATGSRASARALVVGVDAGVGSVETYVSELGDALLELNERRAERVRTSIDLPAADVERAVKELATIADLPDEQLVHLIGPGALGSRSLYFAAEPGAGGLHLGAFLDRLEDVDGPSTLILLDITVSTTATVAAHQRWRLRPQQEGRVAVFGVVIPDQPQLCGRFSDAFAAVLRRLHEGALPIHPSEPFVPLPYLRDAIRRELTLTRGASPLPEHFFVDDVPPTQLTRSRFVVNRRYQPDAAARLELAFDDQARIFLDELAADAPALDPAHYLARAAGRPTADPRAPILFSGRTAELSVHRAWLDEPRPTTALRVVTGQPGVGKSALLGMIVCAAHPSLAALTAFASSRRQCPGQFAAVHARGLLVQEVVHSIGVQLRLGHDLQSASELIAALASRPADAAVPSIVIDALDEATAPREHLDLLLLPLSGLKRGTSSEDPACRLLVGTRPWSDFETLLERADASGGLCNLDAVPQPRQRAELRDYLSVRLRTPFVGETKLADTDADLLAERIAEDLTDARRDRAAGGGPFLVAALHAHRLMTAATRPGVDPMTLRVPAHLGEVLELDLAERRPDRLLRPMLVSLAQAQGTGIPERLLRETTASVATIFQQTGAPRARRIPRPGERRIAELLASVSFYLRRSPGADGTTHHRFFHQALSDHMTRYPAGPMEERR